MLKLALARILILALHLAPAENTTLSMHVIDAGKYRGAYLVEKPEAGQFLFKKFPADSDLQVMEAESSPRYKQFYTVYVRESGESVSINLTRALEALKPFSDKPSQDVDLGDGLKLNVSKAGSLLLLVADVEQKAAGVKPVDAKPAAQIKAPAADKPSAPGKQDTGQLLVIVEKAFQ
jgi:hypothetical protein